MVNETNNLINISQNKNLCLGIDYYQEGSTLKMMKNASAHHEWRYVSKRLVHTESQMVLAVKGNDTNKHKDFGRSVLAWNTL